MCAIELLREDGELQRCQGHRVLGTTYYSKDGAEKAIHHLEMSRRIATSLDSPYQLFWTYFTMAQGVFVESEFDDAHAQIEHTTSHATHDACLLSHAPLRQATFGINNVCS